MSQPPLKSVPYSIGQTIYILSNTSQTVVPAIVFSRNTEENIGLDGQVGQLISYKVKIGPPGKVQIVDLSKIDGEVFISLDEIKQILTNKLMEFVNNLVHNTQEKANAWYGIQKQSSAGDSSFTDSPGNKLDPQQVMAAIEKDIIIQPQNFQSSPMLSNEVGEIMPDGTIRPARGI